MMAWTLTAAVTASMTLGNSSNTPVASGADDAAAMFDANRVNDFAVTFEGGKRAFLIRPHQPRVTGHINGDNGGQPPFGVPLTHEMCLQSCSFLYVSECTGTDQPFPRSKQVIYTLRARFFLSQRLSYIV